MEFEVPDNAGSLDPFLADLAAGHVGEVHLASLDVPVGPVALTVDAVVASHHVLTQWLGSLEAGLWAFGTGILGRNVDRLTNYEEIMKI